MSETVIEDVEQFNITNGIIVKNKIMSGFNSSNYGYLLQSFDPQNYDNWEFLFKTKYKINGNAVQRLCGAINSTSVSQIIIGAGSDSGNKLKLWLSSSGTSWNICSGNSGVTILKDDIDYYFKMMFDGNKYELLSSTDKENWITEISVSSSTKLNSNNSAFLLGNAELAGYWNGSIDLSESYIKVNDEIWWNPYIQKAFTYSDYTFNVMKGMTTTFGIRANGKYDCLVSNKINNIGESTIALMKDYNGLDCSVEEIENVPLILDFSNTILPWKWEYNNKLTTLKYFFKESGSSYSYSLPIMGLENCPIIDNKNWEYNNNKIQNGSISYNISNGFSFGYFEYTPTDNMTLIINANISSEANYDYGAIYVGTEIYNATRNQIINGTTDGNGSWICKISGSKSSTDYSYNLTANTKYYIHFFYTKDSSGNSSGDRFYINSININVYGYKIYNYNGCLYNYTDDGSATTLNCFVDGDSDIILTPDNSYNDKRFLGTVDIPVHTIINQ